MWQKLAIQVLEPRQPCCIQKKILDYRERTRWVVNHSHVSATNITLFVQEDE